MNTNKIFKRTLISLMGGCIGVIIAGIITYIISPNQLIFIITFALITSQIGLFIGVLVALKYFNQKTKKL